MSGVTRKDVVEVATLLNLKLQPTGSSFGISPCPVCASSTRHQKSNGKRPAVGVRPDRQGWRCFQCDASGDALALATLATYGRTWPSLSESERHSVLAAIDPRRSACSSSWPEQKRLFGSDPQTTPPDHPPPAEEVRGLWESARCVVDDAGVAHWLANERGLDPRRVDRQDLARWAPASTSLPPWARYWRKTHHNLLVPMFDSTGKLRSLVARRTRAGGGPKSLPPKGFTRRGLVMADALGQRLLRDAAGTHRPVVVIAEGEIDFLSWASGAADGNTPYATLGIVSGAWTDEVAGRIPPGSRVVIATDHDKAGNAYASLICSSFWRRGNDVTLERWQPS